MDNYEKILDRVSRSSGLEKEEIEKKVEAKKAKLSGLISKEGAAQIVAAELGINFDQERMKVSELIQGMKRVNILGKIISINPIRAFNKNGREGKVASFVLADDTSNIRTVLWDTNHIDLIEKGKIKAGSIIEISNAAIRNNELHLSSFGDIKESKEKLENVITSAQFQNKKLFEIKPGETIQTRAVVVQVFDPKYFEVCPQCGKKAVESECKVHGKIAPTKRALLSIVLDDGTETVRSTLFGDQINLLGLTNEQIFSLEEYQKVKSKILGEEKTFSGQVRNNEMFNTTDFIIQNVKDVDPNELIKELESKH